MGSEHTSPLPGPLADDAGRLLDGFSGVAGLWVHDLRRRETYGLRHDLVVPPASTIKLFVLCELFRQVELGRVSLSDEVELRRRDVVPGTGVLKDLAPGLRLSLADAATLMVTVSDNVATNLMIDRLGTRGINRGIRDAGCRETRLGGKLFRGRGSSTTTAEELGRLMLSIVRGKAVTAQASAAMLRILRREQSDQIVGRYLPFSPNDPHRRAPRWKVASKSGSLLGVRNDVAHVQGDGLSYVVALVSTGCADLRFSLDNEATVCLARLARLVHQWCGAPVQIPG